MYFLFRLLDMKFFLTYMGKYMENFVIMIYEKYLNVWKMRFDYFLSFILKENPFFF